MKNKGINIKEEKFRILLENWSRYRSEEISPAAAVKKHFVWLMINVVVNQNKHNVDFQLSIFVVHSPMARWPFLPYLTAALKC